MARKSDTAPADQSDAPIKATFASSDQRVGVVYPALRISGEVPRKGSTLRVILENDVIYTAKVYAAREVDGGVLVETEGMTPEQ